MSWKSVKKIYQGQYGVHLDPRTAYQRCHELRYDQFNSVQGLVDAMRDYQRMAPQKLRDETLESILWNKVPLELQQEVREITDGSVQELLQKLLKAESVIAERKRRSNTRLHSREHQGGRSRVNERSLNSRITEGSQGTTNTGRETSGTNRPPSSGFRGEASRLHVKCFNCHKKGHLAVNFLEPSRKNENKAGESARVIESGEQKVATDEKPNPWMLTVLTEEENIQSATGTLPRRGPTYKVVLEVDGVKTRALIDHGAQISIVRQELLPII